MLLVSVDIGAAMPLSAVEADSCPWHRRHGQVTEAPQTVINSAPSSMSPPLPIMSYSPWDQEVGAVLAKHPPTHLHP